MTKITDTKRLGRRAFLKAGAGAAALSGLAGSEAVAAKTTDKSAKSSRWDHEADVVVVGFGGAGGCAMATPAADKPQISTKALFIISAALRGCRPPDHSPVWPRVREPSRALCQTATAGRPSRTSSCSAASALRSGASWFPMGRDFRLTPIC